MVRAPAIYACDPTLVIATGPHAGKLLWDVLEVPREPVLQILRHMHDAPATSGVRSDAGRLIRLTLTPGPGTIIIAAAEDMEEIERLRRQARRAREPLAQA